MTEKSRDRVVTLTGSLIISIVTVMVGFSLGATREDSKEFTRKFDGKLDKTEFAKECSSINARITNVEKVQNETLNEISKAMQQLTTQSATMQNDISWIKREIDKKNKN